MDTEGFEPSAFRMRNGRSSTELSALHRVGSAYCCSHSVVVSTPDFESGDRGSNPRGSVFMFVRGCSSNGRALAQHARGTGIDTLHLHFLSINHI
jgi:hypothetical protein